MPRIQNDLAIYGGILHSGEGTIRWDLSYLDLGPDVIWIAYSWTDMWEGGAGELVAARGDGTFAHYKISQGMDEDPEARLGKDRCDAETIHNIISGPHDGLSAEERFKYLKVAVSRIGLLKINREKIGKADVRQFLNNPDKEVRLWAIGKLLPMLRQKRSRTKGIAP